MVRFWGLTTWLIQIGASSAGSPQNGQGLEHLTLAERLREVDWRRDEFGGQQLSNFLGRFLRRWNQSLHSEVCQEDEKQQAQGETRKVQTECRENLYCFSRRLGWRLPEVLPFWVIVWSQVFGMFQHFSWKSPSGCLTESANQPLPCSAQTVASVKGRRCESHNKMMCWGSGSVGMQRVGRTQSQRVIWLNPVLEDTVLKLGWREAWA